MNYSIKVPCTKSKLKDIRNFVGEVLNKHNLSEVQVSTLTLAVDEVCANIIIHAKEANPADCIEISIAINEGSDITFDIIDQSEHPFDISNYEEPSLGELIKKKRKGGIGLILVKKIMDKIELIPKSDCNVCRMVKKLDS